MDEIKIYNKERTTTIIKGAVLHANDDVKKMMKAMYKDKDEIIKFCNDLLECLEEHQELKNVTLDDTEGMKKIFNLLEEKELYSGEKHNIKITKELFRKRKATYSLPQKLIIPNNIVAINIIDMIEKAIDKGEIIEKKLFLDKEKTEQRLISLDKNGIFSLKNLTYFDMCVYAAICTLYHNSKINNEKEMFFSYDMIYRVMVGAKSHTNLKGEIQKEFFKSIEKLKRIEILVSPIDNDYTSAGRLFPLLKANIYKVIDKKKPDDDGFYTLQLENNEKDVPLILYEFSNCNKQYISLDIENLCIKKADDKIVRNNIDKINIKFYLIGQINRIKYGNKNQYKYFSLDNLYNKLNIGKSKRKRQIAKAYIITCLEYWKKANLISDYKQIKERNKIARIEITF